MQSEFCLGHVDYGPGDAGAVGAIPSSFLAAGQQRVSRVGVQRFEISGGRNPEQVSGRGRGLGRGGRGGGFSGSLASPVDFPHLVRNNRS